MKWGKDIGAGPSGLRSTDIVRTHIRAFFDQHLKGKTRPLFSQPSDRYPEVTFRSQTGWTVRLTRFHRDRRHMRRVTGRVLACLTASGMT